MSNQVQLDQYDTNNDLQPISLDSNIAVTVPVSLIDEDENSSNKNKSSVFLLNKTQTSPPKLQSQNTQDIDKFLSLSTDEKAKVFSEYTKQVFQEVNELSNDQKNEAIVQLAAFGSQFTGQPVNKSEIQNLTNAQMENIIIPCMRLDFSGIQNIMLILAKAFTDTMNAQSQDQMQQVQKANLINSFLQNVQQQMQKNIASQQQENDQSQPKISGWGWFGIACGVAVGAALLVATVMVAAPLLMGAASSVVSVALTGDLFAAGGSTIGATLTGAFAPLLTAKGIFTIIAISGALAAGIYETGTSVQNIANGMLQNAINAAQQLVSAMTTKSDTLNNQIQTVSKNISNASDRISQDAGYVQQAINMLGNAMSFKV